MRKIVFIAGLLFLLPLSKAETMLTGQVVAREQVETARKAAFEKIDMRKNLSNEVQIDPDIVDNLRARLNKSCLKDRRIMPFSDGYYAVGYFGQTVGHYYKPDGSLVGIEYFSKPIAPVSWREQHPEDYPIESYTYSYPSGRLESVVQHKSLEEDYGFTPSGKLKSYCLGLECHDIASGRIVHRDIVEPCSEAEVIQNN